MDPRQRPDSLTVTVEDPANVSQITDDGTVSSIDRIGSIWTKASSIFLGRAPIHEEEEIFLEAKSELDDVVTTNGKSKTLKSFLNDDPRTMTIGRRLAIALSESKWYYPKPDMEEMEEEKVEQTMGVEQALNSRAGGEAYPFTHSKRENPDLLKAWAYFEHQTLPRYILKDKEFVKKNICTRIIRKFMKADKRLDRAEPGEDELPTKLYEPIWTPHKQLGDWGIGIGLYFSTLRALSFLTLLAGILNTPNFMYFVSEEYSNGQPGVPDLVRGSAICTDTTWVPCVDCTIDDFDEKRLATGPENITYALKNNCDGATIEQGMINFATLVFMVISILLLNKFMKKREIDFDEDEQTAQDYSVVIHNPPGDATDPEEWRQFFLDAFEAKVTACTIAVDNDLLVRSLVERREILRQIEMSIEPGTKLDILTLAGIAAKVESDRKLLDNLLVRLGLTGIPEKVARLVVLTAKIQGLAQQDYPATNIFLCFETEKDQRRVLSGLNYGSLDTLRNKKTAAKDEKHLFRGERLLSASEPDEPNTVRWQDLNEKLKDRLKQQALTTAFNCGMIALIAFIVNICNGISNIAAALVISISNSVMPMFAKFLTSFEAHSSEGGKQRSLYFKIALFRWVNTAVVISIITPFTATLTDGGLINQIQALFFAEIVTTNAIQLLDIGGHFKRHYLAPRAKTQDAMNLNMQGEEIELAERYTNMTKILFLALWYCAIFPGALFMCSIALFVNYFSDRFSLMRSWKRPPLLGPKISEFSRQYFFPMALVAMALLSSYYWAGFPFDNLCLDESNVSVQEGSILLSPVNGSDPFLFTIETDQNYRYCLQDFFRTRSGFPFVADNQPEGDEWMTEDQETVASIHGWSAVGVIGLILLSFVFRTVSSLKGLFRGTYSPSGDVQGISFSDVPSISAYVPQVSSTVFSYPLLACSVEEIDDELLDWTDPYRDYSFYDLTKDAEVLLRGTDVSRKVVFSQIKHWPPEKKE